MGRYVTPAAGPSGTAASVDKQTALNATKVTVKASPGTLISMFIQNSTAAVEFVQVFNALAANVTVGTTTPTYVIPVPVTAQGGVTNFAPHIPIDHSTGIVIAATDAATGGTFTGTALIVTTVFA